MTTQTPKGTTKVIQVFMIYGEEMQRSLRSFFFFAKKRPIAFFFQDGKTKFF